MTLITATRSELPTRTTDPRLARLLRRVVERRDLWEPLVQFGTEERYWARIPVKEDVDVWLLTWTTFQSTDLHDHGDSEAAFTVVSGALHEIRPNERGQLVPRKFSPGLIQTVLPGQVHDVRNELATPAVSIHAYSPRLNSMTFYQWDNGVITPDRVVKTSLPEVY